MAVELEIGVLIARVLDAQETVVRLVASLPEPAYAEPSQLPGWTRAHVVAHLIGNAQAQARQVSVALRGEQIEVYTGGQEARDAEIERRSRLRPAELRDQLAAAHEAFETASRQVDANIAQRPVTYRSGTMRTVIDGRWMECLVHAVDLGTTDFGWQDWDPEFCRLLISYLLERLPRDHAIRLLATDSGDEFSCGAGDPAEVQAPIAELAAYLSDRGCVDLTDLALGPYPRGSVRNSDRPSTR